MFSSCTLTNTLRKFDILETHLLSCQQFDEGIYTNKSAINSCLLNIKLPQATGYVGKRMENRGSSWLWTVIVHITPCKTPTL